MSANLWQVEFGGQSWLSRRLLCFFFIFSFQSQSILGCGNCDGVFLKSFRPGPARGYFIQLAQTKVISKTDQIFQENSTPAVPNYGNLCIFDGLDILCQPSDAVHHCPPADEPLATSQKQTNILRTKIYRMSFVIHIFQLANLAQHELFLYSHYLSFAFKPPTNKKLSLSPLFKYFLGDDFMDMLLLLKASFIPVRRVLKEVSKQEAKGKRLPCRVQILGVSIFFVLCMFWYGAGRNR